jgi:hypothetical protein
MQDLGPLRVGETNLLSINSPRGLAGHRGSRSQTGSVGVGRDGRTSFKMEVSRYSFSALMRVDLVGHPQGNSDLPYRLS